MNNDLTIVYYTANSEPPQFEARILAETQRVSQGLPLIVVSQQPMVNVDNICVGPQGMSGQNQWRQVLLGVEATKTPYVALAESDFIYPPEYFAFRPPTTDTFYHAMPVWVLFNLKNKSRVYARKTMIAEGATIVAKELLQDRLREILTNFPGWGLGQPPLLCDRKSVNTEIVIFNTPLLSIKTDYGTHRGTPTSSEHVTRDLAPFGPSDRFLEKWFA